MSLFLKYSQPNDTCITIFFRIDDLQNTNLRDEHAEDPLITSGQPMGHHHQNISTMLPSLAPLTYIHLHLLIQLLVRSISGSLASHPPATETPPSQRREQSALRVALSKVVGLVRPAKERWRRRARVLRQSVPKRMWDNPGASRAIYRLRHKEHCTTN